MNGVTLLLAISCTHWLCAQFKLGVENISPQLVHRLSSQRIGLITNQTGRNQAGRQTVDILRDHGINVRALLVPEHGLHGSALAAHDVHDGRDHTRSLPIISLYGNGTGKQIAQEIVNSIDAFIFDIQDSGMRHYTYISTLFYVLEAAAHHNKSLIVLDRPNPLGRVTEGPLVDAHIKSFIAVAPIPLRHGMTVGELARYFNTAHFKNRADLHVVAMSGYNARKQQLATCAMNLSPNIQTLQACYGYSFLGLLGEIRPFDVGIGTPLAFQCITLPKDFMLAPEFWSKLRTTLEKHAVQCTDFTYYSTRKKKQMVGLRIAIDNIHAVSTCALLAEIIANARNHGISVTFSHAFDTAIGSCHARPSFGDPTAWSHFMKKITTDVHTFCKNAASSYLYTPVPVCTAYATP